QRRFFPTPPPASIPRPAGTPSTRTLLATIILRSASMPSRLTRRVTTTPRQALALSFTPRPAPTTPRRVTVPFTRTRRDQEHRGRRLRALVEHDGPAKHGQWLPGAPQQYGQRQRRRGV